MFSVVIITEQDGKQHAVACTTRTIEFVKDAHPGAAFTVLPLEEHWSVVVERMIDLDPKAEVE